MVMMIVDSDDASGMWWRNNHLYLRVLSTWVSSWWWVWLSSFSFILQGVDLVSWDTINIDFCRRLEFVCLRYINIINSTALAQDYNSSVFDTLTSPSDVQLQVTWRFGPRLLGQLISVSTVVRIFGLYMCRINGGGIEI